MRRISHYFSLDSLRHVFVTTVINHDTNGFITQELYRGRPILEPQAWHIGSPAYDALLGTRIGMVVAYLVLGAYERGARRIKSITIWPDTSGCPNLRFDIEPTSWTNPSWMTTVVNQFQLSE